jgi:uncharacterized protein (DUF342 family)
MPDQTSTPAVLAPSSVDPTRAVRLSLSEDAMSAWLVVEDDAAPEALVGVDATLVHVLLAEKGVVITSDVSNRVKGCLDAVRGARGETLAALDTGTSAGPRRWLVAQGTAPVPGVDGRLVFEPEMDPRARRDGASTGEADGSGAARVDHYSRSSITVVRAGTLVARVFPPTNGSDGVDIRGRSLACRRASPVELRTDASLTLRDDPSAPGTSLVVASSDGLLEHEPPMLRVRRELTIDQHVDFSTGNIDFPGDVRVARDVRDRFKVRAGGNLTVGGLVGAGELVVARDATLVGGMSAKEAGTLETGRDARARYLNNVRATIGRDLRVENECVNCELLVGRALHGAEGAIAGGRLVVGGLCIVGTLGAESRTPTEVVLGELGELGALIERAEGLLELVRADATRSQEALDQLRKATKRLTAQQAEQLTELEFSVNQGRVRDKRVSDAIVAARSFVSANTRVDLSVRRQLYAGVMIHAGAWSVRVDADLRGPLRLMLDGSGRPQLIDTSPGASSEPIPSGTMVRIIKREAPTRVLTPEGISGPVDSVLTGVAARAA